MFQRAVVFLNMILQKEEQQEARSGNLAFSNNKMLLANEHQCLDNRTTSDTKSKQISNEDLPGSSHANYLITYSIKPINVIYCSCVRNAGVILEFVGVAKDVGVLMSWQGSSFSQETSDISLLKVPPL